MAAIVENDEEMERRIQYGKKVYQNFATMMTSIIKKTPLNLNEQAIIDGKVVMMNTDSYVDEKSDTNKLKCILDTPDIVPSVSCYPNSIILEIRDSFNTQNPTRVILNADNDIKGILSTLKSYLGYREDKLLSVFTETKQMIYMYKYFLSGKCLSDNAKGCIDPEYASTIPGQYSIRTSGLENKYSNYINIDYTVNKNQEKYVDGTFMKLEVSYNNKYTQSFKNQCVKIMQDDAAIFAIHHTFDHIYLIILLQYFLQAQHVTHISISLSYEDHAQAIYINKSDTGHYMFYNSNAVADYYTYNAQIEKEVLTLLRFTYPQIRIYLNGKHQYLLPLCRDFAMTFIESMLDTTKTLEERFSRAQTTENRDNDIRNCHFNHLNKDLNHIFVSMFAVQTIHDDSNIIQSLLKRKDAYK